jgi:hypothetical protein
MNTTRSPGGSLVTGVTLGLLVLSAILVHYCLTKFAIPQVWLYTWTEIAILSVIVLAHGVWFLLSLAGRRILVIRRVAAVHAAVFLFFPALFAAQITWGVLRWLANDDIGLLIQVMHVAYGVGLMTGIVAALWVVLRAAGKTSREDAITAEY